MIIDAYVTRPEIGGGNLSLWNSTYKLEGPTGVEFGQRTWRRQMVTSPFVHGGVPVTQVLETSTMNLTIQVKATSQESLADAIATLVAAFSQFEYEVNVVFDDQRWAWTCWSADIVVGSDDERMAQWNIQVKLTVPRAAHQNADGGI